MFDNHNALLDENSNKMLSNNIFQDSLFFFKNKKEFLSEYKWNIVISKRHRYLDENFANFKSNSDTYITTAVYRKRA